MLNFCYNPEAIPLQAYLATYPALPPFITTSSLCPRLCLDRGLSPFQPAQAHLGP